MESKLQQQAPQKAQTYKPNLTGIPTQMKLDFERQSGLSFDDVRVHYNSDKPAQLQALAYTQGTQVYVGPGQERHLPHELRHIVQQKQGRVRANGIINNVPVNIETSLEREADTYIPKTFVTDQQNSLIEGTAPIQCRFRFCYNKALDSGKRWAAHSIGRPEFSDDVKKLLPVEQKKTTRNHIISYQAINRIIGEALSQKLNQEDYIELDESPRCYSISNSKMEIILRQLVAMVLPKSTDYVFSIHAKQQIEICEKEKKENEEYIKGIDAKKIKPSQVTACKTRKEAIDNYETNTKNDVLKLNKKVDEQRHYAKKLVGQIVACFSQNADAKTISAVRLDTLANELELYLNNSLGNLRVGNSSINTSIQGHIDPLSGTFKKEIEKGEDVIIFQDGEKADQENLLFSRTTYSYTSKDYSMRKRMTHLFRISRLLNSSKLGELTDVIPGLFMAEKNAKGGDYEVFASNDSFSISGSDRKSKNAKIKIRPVTSKHKTFTDDATDAFWIANSTRRVGKTEKTGPYFFVAPKGTKEKVLVVDERFLKIPLPLIRTATFSDDSCSSRRPLPPSFSLPC